MSADGGVSGRAGQVFSLTEGDMLTLRVLEALGKTEVNNVNIVFRAFIPANKEIVWLNITMDNPLFVHFLNTMDLGTPHEDTQIN